MNRTPLLSPAESRDNQEALAQLREVVQRGEALGLIGAGLSRPLNYPDWDGLLARIENLACGFTVDGATFVCNAKDREEMPLQYADQMKAHIQAAGGVQKYEALLQREFSPRIPRHGPNHDLLIGLPFRGIITPNYDVCLESALAQAGKGVQSSLTVDLLGDTEATVSDFLLSLVDSRRLRRIAHIHGLHDKPKQIVLTAKDYEQAYGLKVLPNGEVVEGQQLERWTRHTRVLWAVLATRELVFVGFSMRDPYIAAMLTFACDGFWRWGQPVNRIILALEPATAEKTKAQAKIWKEKYATEAVFYENTDGSHGGLRDILSDLGGKQGRQSRADAANSRFMGVTDRED